MTGPTSKPALIACDVDGTLFDDNETITPRTRDAVRAAVAALPAVSTSDLQPGDLLFFDGDGHVGIYVGGNELIDAPQTGLDVEKIPLSGWYAANLDSAARP